jgi:hypothetical protein
MTTAIFILRAGGETRISGWRELAGFEVWREPGETDDDLMTRTTELAREHVGSERPIFRAIIDEEIS